MERRSNRRKRLAAAAGVAGCIALAACSRKSQPSKQAQPNIDALREALNQTATVAFPSPSLVSRRFEMVVKAEEIQAKSAEISRIGAELNGTVLPGPPSQSGASLLIRLPEKELPQFVHRALGQSLGPAGEGDPNAAAMVEVVIKAKDQP